VRGCLDTADRWSRGEATDAELTAARATAWDAAWAAARATAWATAWDAAWDAAGAAARAAARATAWDAAQQRFADIVREHIPNPPRIGQ
jgi:hypothetical protein